jgi:AhpD family alkylhydroperoxidase
MAEDPREILNELNTGAGALYKADSERMQAWRDFNQANVKPGALDRKTKELIMAALGLSVRCKYCIVHHVYEALKAGATRQELIETAFATCHMGGGPVVTYTATLFLDAIDAFAPDFGK